MKTEEQKPLSMYEHMSKMQALFSEINMLQEDIKSLKKAAKKDGHDANALATIAKSRASGKTGTLRKQYLDVLDTLEAIEKGSE